jgi:chromosome segregation ATPase
MNLVMETVHSYLNDILQLKAQLKIANDLVSEKDQVISDLNGQIESLRNESNRHQNDESEMQKLRENAAVWEHQYNTMVNKVSHMDALTNQYNDLKKQLIEKTEEVNQINEKFKDYDLIKEELQSTKNKVEKLTKREEKKSSVEVPKKALNKDTKPLSIPTKTVIVESKKTIEETDDF